MPGIFLSYVFGESREPAKILKEKITLSPLLAYHQLTPVDLGCDQAQKVNPEKISVRHAAQSQYTVCLIKNSLGSLADRTETYLQKEINTALASPTTTLFIFLVGEIHSKDWDKNNDLAPSVRSYLASIQKEVVFGREPTDDPRLIAENIVKTLEQDLIETIGDFNELDTKSSPLNISGFNYHNRKNWPDNYKQELSILIDFEEETNKRSPLLANLNQRKQWALESLKLNHSPAALKNFEKALEDFGSDFLCCFWAGRFYSFQKTSNNWSAGYELSMRAYDIAKQHDWNMLQELALNNAARADIKAKNFSRANSLLNIFDTSAQCYETQVLRIELVMAQSDFGSIDSELYSNALMQLVRTNISYYNIVSKDYREKYGARFEELETPVRENLGGFFEAMHSSMTKTTRWASENLGIQLKKTVPFFRSINYPFDYSYTANIIVWQHYFILAASLRYLPVEHERLQEQYEMLAKENQHIETALTELAQLSVTTHELLNQYNNCKQEYATQKKKKHSFLIPTMSYVVGAIAAFTFAPFQPLFSIGPLGLIFTIHFLCYYGKGNRHKATLSNLCNQLQEDKNNYQINIQSYVNSLSNLELDLFSSNSEIETTDSCFQELHDDLQAKLKKKHDTCSNTIKLITHKLSWLDKLTNKLLKQIDKFEKYAISAHNNRYTFKLRAETKISIGKKEHYKTGYFSSYFVNEGFDDTELVGSFLHYNEERLDAYTKTQLPKWMQLGEPSIAYPELPQEFFNENTTTSADIPIAS